MNCQLCSNQIVEEVRATNTYSIFQTTPKGDKIKVEVCGRCFFLIRNHEVLLDIQVKLTNPPMIIPAKLNS